MTGPRGLRHVPKFPSPIAALAVHQSQILGFKSTKIQNHPCLGFLTAGTDLPSGLALDFAMQQMHHGPVTVIRCDPAAPGRGRNPPFLSAFRAKTLLGAHPKSLWSAGCPRSPENHGHQKATSRQVRDHPLPPLGWGAPCGHTGLISQATLRDTTPLLKVP